LVADAGREIGIDESILATLARAVTFPHWKLVAQSWLGQDRLDEWRRFQCPACGGSPALAEDRVRPSTTEGISGARQRLMHCPFCGTQWVVPALKCPACDSTRPGDAKYYYTAKEPELRIDFCKACDHYVKVVNTDKTSGRLHLGLELLTTAHLDAIAHDKGLKPLDICS
jgi:FdhE protein